jgi:hypothetical protein
MRKLWYGVLVMVGLVPAAAAFGATCEQWQDYLYYRDTGDFLTWVGEPYWVCGPSSPHAPPDRPVNDLPGDRDGNEGGQGTSVASMCDDCRAAEAAHARRAEKMRNDCYTAVLWRSVALCEAGHRRGRAQGEPIPQHITRRERVCEDDGRNRPVCKFTQVKYENPAFNPCFLEWEFGFTPEQIAAGRNQDGLRIDTNPVPVDYPWDGGTHMGLLGPGEYFNAVCERDYQRELEVAEDMFDDCEANINEIVTSRGRPALDCR